MKWTLRKKILLGYGMIFVLGSAVFLLAFIDLLELGKASESILKENYKSILAAEKMIQALERQNGAILLIQLGYEDVGLEQFRSNETQFLQWLARARDNITVEGERAVVDAIEGDYRKYLVAFSRFMEIYRSEPSRVSDSYDQMIRPYYNAIWESCVQLNELNSKTMFEASFRAQRLADVSVWSLMVVGTICAGIGLGLSLLLSNRLVKPLQQLMQATQKISQGAYDVQVPTASSDELGKLAVEFNSMAEQLKAFHDLNIGEIVSERRKSAAIIRSIDEGIIVVDAEGRVTNMNPAAQRLLSVELNGQGPRHILEIVKNDQLFRHLRQTLDRGLTEDDEGGRILTLHRGPEPEHYQYSITPIHAVEGTSYPGAVITLRNVTKFKELERLKSEFVMNASHEIRTPLTSVIMSIGLLMESAMEKLSEKECNLLSIAQEELKRLKALANDLLDLSKIESGTVKMEIEALAVNLLFEKTLAVMSGPAGEAGVELSCRLAESLPKVKADANKLVWVLTNLVANALRFADKGGHIRLSAERAGLQVHVSVSDDGEGIPYEHQSKVFDKFYQVKGEKAAGGSGLGLSISKEIVRAHGGSIWVDSVPGEGTTFTFALAVAD